MGMRVDKEERFSSLSCVSRVSRKSGQVWIETVIYTLIGLAVIGLVLAVALPKINDKKSEIAIEQSIQALGNIDDKIYEVQRAPGNRRVVNLEISRGKVVIDMAEDSISWVLESTYPYSEEGMVVPLGRLNVTTRKGSPWEIELKLGYSMDIRYENDNSGIKQLDVAPAPYKFIIDNAGRDEVSGNIVIDLSEN